MFCCASSFMFCVKFLARGDANFCLSKIKLSQNFNFEEELKVKGGGEGVEKKFLLTYGDLSLYPLPPFQLRGCLYSLKSHFETMKLKISSQKNTKCNQNVRHHSFFNLEIFVHYFYCHVWFYFYFLFLFLKTHHLYCKNKWKK